MASDKDIEVKRPDILRNYKPSDFFKKDTKNKEKTFNVAVPKFSKDSTVLTLGSCFAHHVRNALSNLGFETNALVFYDDEITTTLAMKEHFEWIVGDKELRTENVHERKGIVTLPRINNQLLEYKQKSLNTLINSSCVILTFGLSETWISPDNRSVWYWPGKDKTKAENLTFKVLSTFENYENIKEIVKLIRSVNSMTSIVMTLSPIPLGATFRKDCNINLANCASKARIRSAIDEFIVENNDEKVFYWPSYEYVTQYADPWEEDCRHVKPHVVEEIMKEFTERVTK